ncbi:mevalonate kinase family protein [Polaribacter porphyrae]|uniref:Galactokinase n=1 Tax=Polaribacter porphyrae TaxID=1137780 RepID=A0A2S7WJ97_9FLAO|nr:galactokinase family protein [Polaribacter porphyrae]PQJ77663.1 galactokinase [Polaribacter porphyrae]
MEEIVSIAPGRTCLFGDHQDYLGLPIIACAIDKYITLKAIKNNTNYFSIDLPDINQKRKIPVDFSHLKLEKRDFFLSTLRVLKRYNCIPNAGFDIHITGTIPINSGTSSSSALVVAWVQFLLETFGSKELLNPKSISQLAFESEVIEFNASGGKMDQYSIGLGNIIYLETGENFSYEILKTPITGIIMADSGVPKDTEGLLTKLKTNSWRAIEQVREQHQNFDVKNVDEKSIDNYIDLVSKELKPYLEATIGNYLVTKKALSAFKEDNFDIYKIGNLLNEHHHYLKNKLKITVPKIDKMIKSALQNNALGAKIVGSGGGGSIMALATENDEEKIISALKKAGAINVYKANVTGGAKVYIQKNN